MLPTIFRAIWYKGPKGSEVVSEVGESDERSERVERRKIVVSAYPNYIHSKS
jgi:hypothetical protein